MVPVSLDRDPSRTGLGLTAAASLLGAAGTLLAGGGIALVGVPLSVGGVYRCSRRLLAAGVLVLAGGLVAAGVGGVPPWLVLVGATGAALTWDVGDNAISLAEQLRADARTERIEMVHAAASALVAGVFALGGYAVFALSTGGQPSVALALLVIGAALALGAFGR